MSSCIGIKLDQNLRKFKTSSQSHGCTWLTHADHRIRVGTIIVDQKSNGPDDDPPSDGESAYGASRAHALVAENPGKCTTNADSFAWHAIVSLFVGWIIE